MTTTIDYLDKAILTALDENARQSLAEIGKQVGLSGPAVGERMKTLRHKGVIDGFGVRLNMRAIGYSIEALVRIKPKSGQIRKVEKLIAEEPRFMACDRVTGEDCLIARLALRDIAELDDIMFPLHECADTNTSIVKSSLFEPRLPQINITR
ncbi:Lrp/AsnC family transcriptional regulator [Alteromonas lipolytica]|uniref:AsnC family transcriptional regulator n=1 Tax=Alteromonas lipolytica TaxID=1856405 RepID=A0A1E8FEI0_9ALTE|nr:Lrp/AsnC family transcriptional regulator [Alteromonas lipolytica]OFI34166.1 AsnC family transcriptional regulator [Alteromonas lipolytica]GGF84457.1 AsnC family transcriptional regulator [Alteromonas lipolytica]